MRRTFAPLVLSTAAIALLASCAPSVQAPIASIAPMPEAVNAGSFVQLDGSASRDPQNRSLTFNWSFTDRPLGSSATLADANTAKPSFLADLPGDYVVSLTVSNSVLTSTAAATVTVQVSQCAANPPVIHGIQSSRTAMNIGDSAQFSADVVDADNLAPCNLDQTFDYAWLLTQQPEGSRASLNSERSERPSLTADKSGAYELRLIVTDSTGRASDPATFTLDVSECGAAAPAVAPTATPRTTHPNAVVQLDADVTDTDEECGARQTFTVQWSVQSKPDGSTAVLSSSRAENPTFTADKAGAYELGVLATDSTGRSSDVGVVTVIVDACGNVAPTVGSIAAVTGAPGTPPAGTVGTGITVQAVGISSLNCLATGAPTTAWSLTAPSGSRAALSNPAAASPSFTPDVAGDYQVSVQVRDSLGNLSAPAFLRISVVDCTPAPIQFGTPAISAVATDPDPLAPTFTENGNPKPHVGALVGLTPDATVASYCGSIPVTPLTYRWAIASRPAGSQAELDSPTAQSPSLRIDRNGTYRFSVIATDARGNGSAPRSIELDTTSCGVNPIATALLTGTGAPLVTSPQAPASVGSLAPFTIAAQIATDDNVPTSCPSRFQVSADFSYSIEIQPSPGSASLSNVFGDSTVFEAQQPGSYALLVDGAVTNLAGRAHALPAFAYLALAAPPTLTDLPPFVAAGAALAATVHGAPNASYACTISNGAFLAGTASGTLSAAGTALLSLTAGGSPGPMTISCFQLNGGFATGAGTIVSQVVGLPTAPVIQVPTTLTSGRIYVASVSTRPNATYFWSLDNGGAIVSAGGASGTTSGDGSTNSIRFTTGAVGTLHLSVTETDVVGHVTLGSATIAVVGAAVAPAISAPDQVTSTRTYTASVPARGGFTYRWEVFNGSIAVGAEAGLTADGLNTVTFTAGSAAANNGPAVMTLTCTETNATGDSSAPATFTATVYPSPIAPTITVVKQGIGAPITDVSDGPGFVYVATITPTHPQMHYAWTPATGMINTLQSGTQGETFTFSFTPGTGTPAGVVATLKARELNFLEDASAEGTKSLTVFSAPSSTLAIATTSATDSGTGQFPTTSGRTYTASIVSRGGAMTYQWSGDNVIIGTPGTGASTAFTAGSANPDNSPKDAALRVRETNGAGDSAESSRAGLVYPAPQAPTYRVARAPSGPPVTNQKITQTFEYMATLVTHAQMTYHWQIAGGSFSAGGTSSVGSFIESGAKNQVKFSADDASPSTTPTNVSLEASEINAIGDLATSVQPDLTAFPVPITPSFAAGTTDLTAGDAAAVSITAPRTNLFYQWTIVNGTFSDGSSSAVGNSVAFTAGTANSDGTPRDLVLSVVEVNGTPDFSAAFAVVYRVFPKPEAPLVVLTSGSGSLADEAGVTEGDAIHGSITNSSQPGITFSWTASHSNPANGSGTTFDFTGANDDPAGNPVVAQIVATASNAIGNHADSATRSLRIYPLPAAPDVLLATGAGSPVTSASDVTAGSFQATTTSPQKSTMTYQWSVTPAANRANVTGDTTVNVHFDALANADGSNATVTVSIAVSNVLGASRTANATLVVHPAPQTPTIHIVGPDGNDGFVTQGATGVHAQVAARAHFHYLWTYAVATGAGVSAGTLTNAGGTAGDLSLDGLTNSVVFTVPTDAVRIRLSCAELNDLEVASTPGKLQATAVPPPAIQTFNAYPQAIYTGGAVRLTAGFTGGTGEIDHGVGPATSALSVIAPGITASTIFTVTVTNAAGTTTSAVQAMFVTSPTAWVDFNNPLPPPDTRAATPFSLTFDPANPSRLYAATINDGVLRTTTIGPSWADTGFPPGVPAYGVTVGHPDGTLSLWASVDCSGKLYHSIDAAHWTEVTGNGLPTPAACGTGPTDIKLDPSDPTQKTLYVAFSDAGLFWSQDDGTTWAQIHLPVDVSTNDDTPTKLTLATDGTLFVGTTNGHVFRVSGGTVTQLATTNLTPVDAIAVDPGGTTVIAGHADGTVELANAPAFAFTTGHVFGSGGGPATPVNGLAFAVDGTIGTVGGQPAITGSVYAVVANGVWRSIDSGASFTDVTAASPAIDDSTYFSVAVHPFDGTLIYVLGGTPTPSGFFKRTFSAP